MTRIFLFVIFIFCVKIRGKDLFLKDFTENVELGRDLTVSVLVKGFDQGAKNRRTVEFLKGKHLGVVGGKESRDSTRGATIITSLDKDELTLGNADLRFFSEEPTHVSFHNHAMTVAGGESVIYYDFTSDVNREFTDEWFRHLHSSAISSDGKKALVGSSGFDMLFEISLETGEKLWEWSAWDSGFDRSRFGHYFTLSNKRAAELEKAGEEVYLVSTPSEYPGYGIPTRNRPCHLNGAEYGRTEDSILVTLGHQGKGIIVNKKTGTITEAVKGLGTPHAFAGTFNYDPKFEYVVQNTKKGVSLFLDKEGETVLSISLSGVEGVVEGREGLGEWTQFLRYMKDDIYTIVDIHRRSIWIVDIVKNEYRRVLFPREWAVQLVALVPETITPHLVKSSSLDRMDFTDLRGQLVELEVTGTEAEELMEYAQTLDTLDLTETERTDFEMIALGGLTPVTGFMGEEDFLAVVHDMRLANGIVWSLPILKSVCEDDAEDLEVGQDVALTDGEDGSIVGVMTITDIYKHDKALHCRVYGTDEMAHPGVALVHSMEDVLVGGPIKMLARKKFDSMNEYRFTPRETREMIAERGWKSIGGFQTRNPLHRSHEFLLVKALENFDGVLIHPLVGKTKKGDVPAEVRMASYELVADIYLKGNAVLATYPAWMRYAGPREAIFHGLVRRNYGATDFVVGRDHAGVGKYYGPFDAQEIFKELSFEMDIDCFPVGWVAYCKKCGGMVPLPDCPHGKKDWVMVSGSKVRQMIADAEYPPGEVVREEVAHILIASAWLDRIEDEFTDDFLLSENNVRLNWEEDHHLIYWTVLKGNVVKKVDFEGGNAFLIKYKNVLFLDVLHNKKRYFVVLGKSSKEMLQSYIDDEISEFEPLDTGVTFWLTGLSGCGKSTICKQVVPALREQGLMVEHLDGDYVRKILNRDLGFSEEDRHTNNQRISDVCAYISRMKGVAVSSFISPYRKTRESLKPKFEGSKFVEVFIDTPLEECIRRDVKGLYKLAIDGIIKKFTGISDPYEEPLNPGIHIVWEEGKTVEDSVMDFMDQAEVFLKGDEKECDNDEL